MKRIAVYSSFAWIKVANNYGALLQYYALQQYLMKRGNYVFWIKFVLTINPLRRAFQAFKQMVKTPSLLLKTYFCHRSFMKFCNEYLNMSDQIYDIHSHPESYPFADIYITGSDQVWGGTQPEAYLSFVHDDGKKIAYAASFGKDHLEKGHFEKVAPWIRRFRKVSVRENSGVEICRSMGVDAIHLLDPTLLLNEDGYPHKQRLVAEPYVFTYFINLQNKEHVRWTELQQYAKSSGKRLIVSAAQGSQYLFDGNNLMFPSPIEWLTMYKYADAIVTNTFHGTVFAIIHKRQFVCILQSGRSATQNTRMYSLLRMLGLEDRILKKNEKVKDLIERRIDWAGVDDRLVALRKRTDLFFDECGI